jgi:P4 family phage/plasmid primase-like protien
MSNRLSPPVDDRSVDVDEAMRLVGHLVRGDQDAIVTIQTFDDSATRPKRPSLTQIRQCSLNKFPEIMKNEISLLARQGAGVFLMINGGDGKGRKNANVVAVRAVFVDFDENGDEGLKKIENSPGVPKPHFIVQSSSGKYHVYWLVAEMALADFKKVQTALGKRFGGDPSIKDLARVMRLPGSLHQKGKPVRVEIVSENLCPPYQSAVFTNLLKKTRDNSILETANSRVTAQEVEWVNSLRRKTKPEDAAQMLGYLEDAADYDRWLNVGMALHNEFGDEGLAMWLKWSSQADNFDEEECLAKWKTFGCYRGNPVTIGTIIHLAKEGGWSPRESNEPLTDAGNAQRLVRLFGGNFRYCREFTRWFIWNGKYWEPDSDGAIVRYTIDSARRMLVEANGIESLEQRERFAKWAFASESKVRIDAAIKIAQSVEGVTIHPDQMDKDPFLFNVANCTINLKTGEQQSHSRANLITKRSKVRFLEKRLQCPAWMKFLYEIMAGNRELIDYLQRVIGYCLTGDTREQCLFFLHGYGANGKSTFINVLTLILGDYAIQTSSETFMIKQSTGGATPELAALDGGRIVTANETEDGKQLAESTIKQLCGGDPITVRMLYGSPFSFYPAFKIWIAGNHKPQIRGGDLGIWRRIHLIPFIVTFPPEKQDKQLYNRLKAELPAILQWAVEGCLKWQEQGLAPPAEVISAVEDYRENMDSIGQWLDECCEYGPGLVASSGALYASYKQWAMSAGQRPLSKKRLGDALRMRGLMATKVDSQRGWQGVAVNMFKGAAANG